MSIEEPGVTGSSPPNLRLIVIGWKIYYCYVDPADNTKYITEIMTSKEKTWNECPEDNVICVVLFFKATRRDGQENYRRIMAGNDYYWNLEEVPGKPIYGMGSAYDPSIPHGSATGVVKNGKWLPDTVFGTIMQQVEQDKKWIGAEL